MALNFKIADYIDKDTGLLNPRPYLPISTAGNVLEVTGKLFIWMYLYNKVDQYKDVIQSILEAYKRYEVVPGFVPRTVAFQDKEPKESEDGKWEDHAIYVDPKPRSVTRLIIWLRTDVSHSQLWYIWRGLYLMKIVPGMSVFDGKHKEYLISNAIEERLTSQKFLIKNLAGKTVKNGKFFTYKLPFGNHIWRAKSIASLSGTKLSWWQNRRVQANAWAYRRRVWGGQSDIINTVYVLYGQPAYHDIYMKYLMAVDMDLLKQRYLNPVKEDKVNDCLNFLNMKFMRNEVLV